MTSVSNVEATFPTNCRIEGNDWLSTMIIFFTCEIKARTFSPKSGAGLCVTTIVQMFDWWGAFAGAA
jgi:hypothetical protein